MSFVHDLFSCLLFLCSHSFQLRHQNMKAVSINSCHVQIETVLDEATAELGKIEAFPFLATRSISFQIRKPVPIDTTLSVKCNVQSIKGLKCFVHGTIENPVDGVVLASCEAELINMAALLPKLG